MSTSSDIVKINKEVEFNKGYALGFMDGHTMLAPKDIDEDNYKTKYIIRRVFEPLNGTEHQNTIDRFRPIVEGFLE